MQYFPSVFFSWIFIDNIIILLTLYVCYHLSTEVSILGLWFLMLNIEIVGFYLPELPRKLFDTSRFFCLQVYSTGSFILEFRIF